mgnify:CR=1 FL=1
MMEQNWQNDPVKSPEIQEIILSNRIGIIAAELSKRLEITPEHCNCFMKARLALTCMTRKQGFIFMVISISLMNSCESIKISYKFIQPYAK